jgi:hypothetical protein
MVSSRSYLIWRVLPLRVPCGRPSGLKTPFLVLNLKIAKKIEEDRASRAPRDVRF